MTTSRALIFMRAGSLARDPLAPWNDILSSPGTTSSRALERHPRVTPRRHPHVTVLEGHPLVSSNDILSCLQRTSSRILEGHPLASSKDILSCLRRTSSRVLERHALGPWNDALSSLAPTFPLAGSLAGSVFAWLSWLSWAVCGVWCVWSRDRRSGREREEKAWGL